MYHLSEGRPARRPPADSKTPAPVDQTGSGPSTRRDYLPMQTRSYTIPSATTPGRSYRVTVHADGVLACDCPDATWRRRQCKHQRQVIATKTARPVRRVVLGEATRALPSAL